MSTLSTTNIKNPSAASNNVVLNADGTVRLPVSSTPASASATGSAGEIRWDGTYIYICTATNTWRRILHATW
jgi:hypothetical protein